MSDEIETRNIGLSGIGFVGDLRLRKLRPEIVDVLVESMREVGQLQAIVVCPSPRTGYMLIVGRHRLEAARRLGWDGIRAEIVPDFGENERLLLEIDENLARGELSPAERADHTARRKEIFEELHPEKKWGASIGKASGRGRPKIEETDSGSSIDSFIAATAKATGKGKTTVTLDAARGKQTRLNEIAGTSLDKGVELDALAELGKTNPAIRDSLIDRAAAGEKVSAKTEAKKVKRDSTEAKLGAKQAALPDKKYGLIYGDPPWRFEPWSRETGMDRAADNHYPTIALPSLLFPKGSLIPIAANDCVLFLWATVPMLPQALGLMGDWGFQYRSHIIWEKDRIGTGYWFRNKHELLLVGTHGNVPAPAPGTQWPSLIEAPVGAHSAKPECFLEMIEAYFPSLPKIELFRRGVPRPGWDAWGNELDEAAE